MGFAGAAKPVAGWIRLVDETAICSFVRRSRWMTRVTFYELAVAGNADCVTTRNIHDVARGALRCVVRPCAF